MSATTDLTAAERTQATAAEVFWKAKQKQLTTVNDLLEQLPLPAQLLHTVGLKHLSFAWKRQVRAIENVDLLF